MICKCTCGYYPLIREHAGFIEMYCPNKECSVSGVKVDCGSYKEAVSEWNKHIGCVRLYKAVENG